MLVKTAGVKHLVILINKMDDPTVKWEQKRYDYCKDQLTPYLKSVGFNPAKGGCHFMPCSGLTGQGIMEPVGNDAPWYTGLPFIPYIDGLDTLKRHVDGPFMMPIVDKYSEMGTVLIGKVRPVFRTLPPNRLKTGQFSSVEYLLQYHGTNRWSRGL